MSMTVKIAFTGTIVSALLATQVLAAAEGACLQRNRMSSWRPIDDRTLEMTDRDMKKYTVQLRSRCTLATRTSARLVYRNWTNLSCLRGGEVITVFAPGGVRGTCVVSGVQAADAPAPAGGN
jgi:hypothetical protein